MHFRPDLNSQADPLANDKRYSGGAPLTDNLLGLEVQVPSVAIEDRAKVYCTILQYGDSDESYWQHTLDNCAELFEHDLNWFDGADFKRLIMMVACYAHPESESYKNAINRVKSYTTDYRKEKKEGFDFCYNLIRIIDFCAVPFPYPETSKAYRKRLVSVKKENELYHLVVDAYWNYIRYLKDSKQSISSMLSIGKRSLCTIVSEKSVDKIIEEFDYGLSIDPRIIYADTSNALYSYKLKHTYQGGAYDLHKHIDDGRWRILIHAFPIMKERYPDYYEALLKQLNYLGGHSPINLKRVDKLKQCLKL